MSKTKIFNYLLIRIFNYRLKYFILSVLIFSIIIYFVFIFKIRFNASGNLFPYWLSYSYIWIYLGIQFIFLYYFPLFYWFIKDDFFLRKHLLVKKNYVTNLIIFAPFLIFAFSFNLLYYFLTLIIVGIQSYSFFLQLEINWLGLFINSNLGIIAYSVYGFLLYFLIKKIKSKSLVYFLLIILNIIIFIFTAIPRYVGQTDYVNFNKFLVFVRYFSYFFIPSSYSFDLISFSSNYHGFILDDPWKFTLSNVDKAGLTILLLNNFKTNEQIASYALEGFFFILFFALIFIYHPYKKLNFSKIFIKK